MRNNNLVLNMVEHDNYVYKKSCSVYGLHTKGMWLDLYQ